LKRGENKGGGLIKTSNGWSYRITYTAADGKRHDLTRTTDSSGQPLKTKKQAQEAKAAHLLQLKNPQQQKEKTYYITFAEAWQLFEEKEAQSKAEGTTKKYNSVWKNHIESRFGKEEMNTTTTQELASFLLDKYAQGLSFGFVESFLKCFYLLFGVAERAERLEPGRYARICTNKETKLKMPPKREEDKKDITIYNSAEINQIARICKNEDDGDIYPVFLLAYFCGLRLGEILGLMWSDVDYGKGTISINRQLQPTDDGLFMLCKLKTEKARRIVDMPATVRAELATRHKASIKAKEKTGAAYKDNERVINKLVTPHETITSGDFVNRRSNGALVTQNSLKKIQKLIKAAGIANFHFHALRATHISILAGRNVPPSEVMRHAGHSNFNTTLKFYINSTTDAKQQLLNALEHINTNEKKYIAHYADGTEKTVTEAQKKAAEEFAKSYPTTENTAPIFTEIDDKN